jgi:predicted GIY-YIG superfamily endonuclease
VYLFLGDGDVVLYVGKATVLRSRLRQHANAGPPTSRLHRRYDLVRRVVWQVAESEEAAAWREADLIFALRPPFNANPGLRCPDPVAGVARPPFVVVTEGADTTLQLALQPDSAAVGRVYGCFPHLGKGVASRLGIACSDGYVALLRLLWAASDKETHTPASITQSAPWSFQTPVALELRPGLHRLLSGVSVRVVDTLIEAASTRPPFMQPALARDKQSAAAFFAAGPHLLRQRRLRHGLKTTPVDASTYRNLVIDEIRRSVGDVYPATSIGDRE